MSLARTIRILTIVGARPQFIKAAGVSRAIAEFNSLDGDVVFEETTVHTGQHYDELMSEVFFDELGLEPPKYNLGVGSASHGAQTAEMLRLLEPVLLDEAPEVVLLYGDTNTTLAGALAASKLPVVLAHVEAGLRSRRRDMPEEVNRIVTDHVSTVLFAPSDLAVANLRREGIIRGVHQVGDVMHDVLLRTLRSTPSVEDPSRRLHLSAKYAVATIHRAQNTDSQRHLAGIFAGLGAVAEHGVDIVVPLHPRTRRHLAGDPPRGVQIIDPVGHSDLVRLMQGAFVVLTDSGGVQKEAYWLGVPCVTLRDETEWPETVDVGWNVTVGCDPARIVAGALRSVQRERPPLYGDGRTGAAIVDALRHEVLSKASA